MLVRGLGLGIVLIPVMTVAFVDIDSADIPDASMITRIAARRLVRRRHRGVVLESALTSGHALGQAFGQAFGWTTGFTALAVVTSFFLPGRQAADPAQLVPAEEASAEEASAEEAAPAAAGRPATAHQRW